MKYVPAALLVFVLALLSFTEIKEPNQKSSDELKVESAVEKWAAETFYKNDGKKFEHFRAEYSDEFYIYKLKIEMYEKKLRVIEGQNSKGSYPKSPEEFTKEKAELEKKIGMFKEMAKTCKPKVYQYSIKYWTNVQLSNGILVYYSFDVVLDDDYKVVSHKVADKIGDKDDNATIVYK